MKREMKELRLKLDQIDGKNHHDGEEKEELDEIRQFLTSDTCKIYLPEYYTTFKDEEFEKLMD